MDTPLTDVLLCCFVVEDRNFALFNFVNEQNNEAEALREHISQVSVPLSDFPGSGCWRLYMSLTLLYTVCALSRIFISYLSMRK